MIRRYCERSSSCHHRSMPFSKRISRKRRPDDESQSLPFSSFVVYTALCVETEEVKGKRILCRCNARLRVARSPAGQQLAATIGDTKEKEARRRHSTIRSEMRNEHAFAKLSCRKDGKQLGSAGHPSARNKRKCAAPSLTFCPVSTRRGFIIAFCRLGPACAA